MPRVDDTKQNHQMSWPSNTPSEHKSYLNMNTSANKCLSICAKGSTNITQLLHIWQASGMYTTYVPSIVSSDTLHKSNFFFWLVSVNRKEILRWNIIHSNSPQKTFSVELFLQQDMLYLLNSFFPKQLLHKYTYYLYTHMPLFCATLTHFDKF